MTLPNSPETVLLLHNPRCSKSRKLKAALEERGAIFTERLYLDDPLDLEELLDLVGRLGGDASLLIRTKEVEYGQAGLSSDSTREQLLEALVSHPKLMERPVLVRGTKAALGRPTADVALDIL